MLRTRFSDMFDLRYPVMSAPMASHSGGTLAGAVSAAGALGTFGGINSEKGPDWIHAEIATIRAATDNSFGVGFISAFLTGFEPHFEATLAERPAAVALSFGDPGPWLLRSHEVGARVICQVQSLDDAAHAVDAGADVLAAQGNEAGGHTGTMGMLPFLAAVVGRYPDVPVLAAGGVADGRTLAAALTAGADGAWMGTAFLATPEAVEVEDVHKKLIVESDGTDTVFTHVYDLAYRVAWPHGIGARLKADAFTDEWDGREPELRARLDGGDPPAPTSPPAYFGPAAGSVGAITAAADVVRSVCDDAETVLRSRPGAIVT